MFVLRAGCQFAHNALLAVLESLDGMVRDLVTAEATNRA
jgi:hypothetical protein